ncbi:hypothetical protein SDC9_76639 [bioreactor metagenome]|uniref:Uncharacterized protein n=1 Tax=bioreactor metagenome TaxID=1076179 RepID=A0A644YNK7_9ZZZZ
MVTISKVTELGSNEFKQDIVILVPAVQSSVEDILLDILRTAMSAKASGSTTEEDTDSTYGVRGSVTVHYSRGMYGVYTTMLLTKVSGGYTILDRQLKVTRQSLSYGCLGITSAGWSEQSGSANPTSSSWAYTTPSSWYPVLDETDFALIGANCTFTVQRAGSTNTWDFSIVNNVVGG